MKKIYTLFAAAALSVSAYAQTSVLPVAHVGEARSIVRPPYALGERVGTDTTGIGVNATMTPDWLPIFAPSGTVVTFYTGSSVTSGGYVYGNNMYGANICAQGYQNLNVGSVAAKVDGVILWFTKKRSSGASSGTSKVVIKAWNLAANKAYNTDGSGGVALNSMGPATSPSAPVASADLLFSAIDTNFLVDNYVPFATPPTFVGDFAIGMDATGTNLAAGDTVGLFADDASSNDAANLDYAFTYYASKWYVCDYLWSGTAGNGLADCSIAMFAVFSNATGVTEFMNGMKLTNYPNPAVSNTVIDYTLENDSKNVSLTVYTSKGEKVAEHKMNNQKAGNYKITVETADLAAGNYFYQLKANGHNFTKKLVVTK